MSEMSNELIITPLSLVAKEIREQIKRMIPETSTGVSSEEQSEQADRRPIEIRGGILYGGKLLAKKISELVTAMSPTDIDKDWRWTVAHFYEVTEALNDASQMYLIPLSENSISTIKESKVLEGGYHVFARGQPILNAGASVIFMTPPVTTPIISPS